MRALSCSLALLLILAIGPGCETTPAPSFSFDPSKLKEIDALVEQGIAERRWPGAVLWIERDGQSYHKAIGKRALEPEEEPMTEDTIFDAASLTKVIATTPAIMLLAQRGELDIEAPVMKYIEEFRRDGKDTILVRHLLTHTSGLRAGLGRKVEGPRAAVAYACQEKPTSAPGQSFTYSDINFILLGEIVQRVGGRPREKIDGEEK